MVLSLLKSVYELQTVELLDCSEKPLPPAEFVGSPEIAETLNTIVMRESRLRLYEYDIVSKLSACMTSSIQLIVFRSFPFAWQVWNAQANNY